MKLQQCNLINYDVNDIFVLGGDPEIRGVVFELLTVGEDLGVRDLARFAD